jgi:hypothetical protein
MIRGQNQVLRSDDAGGRAAAASIDADEARRETGDQQGDFV